MSREIPAILQSDPSSRSTANVWVESVEKEPQEPLRTMRSEGTDTINLSPFEQKLESSTTVVGEVEAILGAKRNKFLSDHPGDMAALLRWQKSEIGDINSRVFFAWDDNEYDPSKVVDLIAAYNALDDYGLDGCGDEELMRVQERLGQVADGYAETEKFLRRGVLQKLLKDTEAWQFALTESGLDYYDQDLFILQNLHLLQISEDERKAYFDTIVDRRLRESVKHNELQALILCGLRNFEKWNPMDLVTKLDQESLSKVVLWIIQQHRSEGIVRRLIESVLSDSNLPKEVLTHWWKSLHEHPDSLKDYRFTAVRNIAKILELRAVDLSLPKKVYNQAHIMNFGQYSVEQLQKQVDPEWLASRTELYPVVLPRADYNGAFYSQAEIKNLVSKIDTATDSVMTWECEKKSDIFRSLLRMHKLCPKAKIKTLFLGAHGQATSMQFGMPIPESDRKWSSRSDVVPLPEYFRVRDLHDMEENFPHVLEAVREMFAPGANIVLVSCVTGKEAGLAQELSRVLGVEVIAPNIPTHIDLKTLQRRSDNTFILGFHKDRENGTDPTKHYYAGQAE